jgi:hypothetical protein
MNWIKSETAFVESMKELLTEYEESSDVSAPQVNKSVNIADV